MELILNPTKSCNFKCDFCSAANLPHSELSIDLLEEFIKEHGFELNIIIVNGGDPLVLPPEYYYRMLKAVSKYVPKPIPISLTTNLYDFYLHPNKWVQLFKEPYFGVITSFQIDGRRKLGNGEVYTLEKYKKTISLFKELVGYIPDSIAVISKDNAVETMKKTIMIAKEVGNKCALNKALTLGKQKDYYPRWQYLTDYLEAVKDIENVEKYEKNFENIYNFFNFKGSSCPLARNCYKSIRCLNTDGTLYPCANLATTQDYYKYRINGEEDFSHKYQCYDLISCVICENFSFCNSCRIYIEEALRNNDTNYCKGMDTIIPKLKKFFINYNK